MTDARERLREFCQRLLASQADWFDEKQRALDGLQAQVERGIQEMHEARDAVAREIADALAKLTAATQALALPRKVVVNRDRPGGRIESAEVVE